MLNNIRLLCIGGVSIAIETFIQAGILGPQDAVEIAVLGYQAT